MPTRSFPVGANSDRAAGETSSAMAKDDSTSAPKDARAGRDLVELPRIVLVGRTLPGRGCRAFQTSQDNTTGSNSFAHVRSVALAFSGPTASAGVFEKAAMTS